MLRMRDDRLMPVIDDLLCPDTSLSIVRIFLLITFPILN